MDASAWRGHDVRMRTTWPMMLALGLGSLACGRAPERAIAPQASNPTSGAEAQPELSAERQRPSSAEASTRDTAVSESPEGSVSPPAPGEAETAVAPDVEALANAFAERLTVSRRHDGTRVLTPSCRNGPVPCEERLLAFATLIVEIAGEHDVDPLLVAAMAIKESGLDPSVLGRRREAGILQLHPRGAGRHTRFVRDARYRARCQSRTGACQREVIERALETLVRGMEECGGLRGGLGAYASGHCTTSVRYIDRVLEERARLRRLVRQARQQ